MTVVVLTVAEVEVCCGCGSSDDGGRAVRIDAVVAAVIF